MLAVLDRLDQDRFQATALAPKTGPLAKMLGQFGIRHLPLELRDSLGARLPRPTACQRLRSAIATCRPDVVHANSLSMGRLTGAISSQIRIPCIAHLRDILKLSRKAIDDLNRNHMLVAVSQATAEYHINNGLDHRRTKVVYNGVDCELFRPRKHTGYLHRQLNLPEHSFLIATIGQIALRKGLHGLADAAARVAHRPTNIHYLLVGERNSQKEESILYEQAIIDRFRASQLQDRLHCLGYRTDIPQLLNEIQLLVHSAHQEPFGRVLLEAAASGVAIVATRVGGTEEMLEDGRSARLVDPNSPTALSKAIVELHDDSELRRRLARAALQEVTQRFPIESAVVDLLRVWESSS